MKIIKLLLANRLKTKCRKCTFVYFSKGMYTIPNDKVGDKLKFDGRNFFY